VAVVNVNLKGIVSGRTQASGLLTAPGDAVLVQRSRPRLIILACPCGCGDEIPVNLDSRAGKAWRFYPNESNSITLFPSVWRDTGCESHFIIWRDRIWLFGSHSGDEDRYGDWFDTAPSTDLVLSHLQSDSFVHFSEIAERIDAIPWDVLAVCRSLVRVGAAMEDKGKRRGKFRRKAQFAYD